MRVGIQVARTALAMLGFGQPLVQKLSVHGLPSRQPENQKQGREEDSEQAARSSAAS
jgi:hypothetical protein